MKIENHINNYISNITDKIVELICISPINYNLYVLIDLQLSHTRHSLLRCKLLYISINNNLFKIITETIERMCKYN